MGLGKERREELREMLRCGIGYSDVTVPPAELRTLLESDEALERAQKVVEDLKADPDHEMQDIGYNIDRAISGDGGKDGK